MASTRRKRHHVVPRFHLSNFADDTGSLTQVDVLTGAERRVHITDACVVRDFYTVTLADGTHSDTWERRISELENLAAPALRRVLNAEHFQVSEEDRHALSAWIALQYVRGTDSRRTMSEVVALSIRMNVGMAGLAYLRHTMEVGLGRTVPLAEAESIWADIHSSDGPKIVTPPHHHMDLLARSLEKAAGLIYNRTWACARFERKGLIVADSPIGLVRADTPNYLGVGLANAPAIAVPLGRRCLLWLNQSPGGRPGPDRDMSATAAVARSRNSLSVLNAERFVYRHPADAHAIPNGLIPRTESRRVVIDNLNDFANRDRPLEDALKYIADRQATGATGNELFGYYTWPIEGYDPPA